MAKWGEGDARWIVEERPDGLNPNNWHWSEKNCTPWSKKRISEIFSGELLFTDPLADVTCATDVTVSGECTANNRKGKLIFFYELEVKCGWHTTAVSGEKVSGDFEIIGLSEENELDELDVLVSVKDESNATRPIKDLMRSKGKKVVLEKIGVWLKDLKHEYSTNLIRPTLSKETMEEKAKESPAHTSSADRPISAETKGPTKMDSKSTANVTIKAEFKCSASDAYSVFTDPQKVQAWAQTGVKMVPEVGHEWSLFGGNVTGKFLELEPSKMIKQTWRFSSWAGSHHSEVTITFDQGSSSTAVSINQTGVPKAEAEKVKEGWRQNYLKRINSVFGYGADFGEF
eukprot:CFRG6860T1